LERDPAWLIEFGRNYHSQAGEDGIVEKILALLPANDRWCVEFGAWDGLHLSNSRHLIEDRGYLAVLIEGSSERFADLRRNYAANPRVTALNAFVGFTAADGLDALLASLPIPQDFDLLSIDIDGNDYHVWKAVAKYRPKVVCIEFNPTIPTEVSFTQQPDPALNQGSSVTRLTELGKEKGYELVCVLHHNAFFVDGKYFALFGIADNRPATLRKDLSSITYIFSGFDGTLFLDGERKLIWHGLPLLESRIQHLPEALRKFPGNYTAAEQAAFAAFRAASAPERWLDRLFGGRRRDRK
jgi:hypothetical protein